MKQFVTKMAALVVFAVIIWGVIYVVCSAVCWNFNPGKWNASVFITADILLFFLLLLIFREIFLEEEDDQ